ncbi:hypothetical protein DM02DRAFT_671640 [Periconia macrospinosa]|uniref:Uncharacterized protein n=1 Tax=Periconia macrospinosa TaxID=97972 RepID=A0A2V1DS80_9PLEO|nr:hypothetical protein DM02DRAFT_671640 [Periconia macrospinosa]
MAGVDGSGSEAALVPTGAEDSDTTTKPSSKLSRRKWTLLAITTLLNVLLWSSLISCGVTVYQIVSDIQDTSNLTSEVFTLTSSWATFSYVLLHTVFAFKQQAWKYQGRRPFIEKASYVATRFAATVCVLWLLTTGWNMIIIARQLVCLPQSPSLQSWQAGPTCHANQIGVTFSTVALLSSFTLFYILSTVRRPFEAHLFKHGYKPSSHYNLTPGASRRPSLSPSPSSNTEKHPRTTHTTLSTPSALSSTTDIETLDLNSTSPPLPPPSPIHTNHLSLRISTSNAQLPPLPLPIVSSTVPPARQSSSSLTDPIRPTISTPSTSSSSSLSLHFLPPSHISSLTTHHQHHHHRHSSAFIPLTLQAAHHAPSTWRALHPSSPLRPVHPNPQLPLSLSFRCSPTYLPFTPYKSHYSTRFSISLTRPHRLSGVAGAGPGLGSTAISSSYGGNGDVGKGMGMV